MLGIWPPGSPWALEPPCPPDGAAVPPCVGAAVPPFRPCPSDSARTRELGRVVNLTSFRGTFPGRRQTSSCTRGRRNSTCSPCTPRWRLPSSHPPASCTLDPRPLPDLLFSVGQHVKQFLQMPAWIPPPPGTPWVSSPIQGEEIFRWQVVVVQ